MTQFVMNPYDLIEIKNIIKIDFEEFQKRRILEEIPPKWANGVLFANFPAPETVDTVREEIAGKQYWFYVEITKMPQKTPMLKMDGRELPVLDVSTNYLFDDFTKWLIEQPIWDDKS